MDSRIEAAIMPSPFPGMNPYLEQPDTWEDFHQSLMTEMRNQIVASVGAGYVVKLEAHIYLHELSAEERRFAGKADIGVSDQGRPSSAGSGSAIMEAPVHVHLPVVEQERSSYIEIRDREARTLITVIEMLSPTNKFSGPDREAYIAKRRNLLNGPVNFVELDLSRGGPRMPIPELPDCAYYVLVRRVVDWPIAGLWPIQLRERLPRVHIPLRAPDEDVAIDLQEIVHAVYDKAGYANYIYSGKPTPALSRDEEQWASALIPPQLNRK